MGLMVLQRGAGVGKESGGDRAGEVKGGGRRPPRLVPGDITRVAGAMLSTRAWLEKFGSRLYKVRNVEIVAAMCERGGLPAGWQSVRLGSRFYIYYAGAQAEPPNTRGLTREQVATLKAAARRGLEFGDQKKFAVAFGCSESQISRVLRGLRRANVTRQRATKKPALKNVRKVSPAKVEAVFDRLLTVKEWAEHVGPRYNIHSLPYVYQMCSERPNGPRLYPTKLPDDWQSVRVGDSWLVFNRRLQRRAEFLGRGDTGGS